MAITNYKATFTASNGAEIVMNRTYAKPLSHAWRVEYTKGDNAAVKSGFSGSKEAAEKAAKLPKNCTVTKLDIVEVENIGIVASKAKPKAAKVAKPCAVGDIVAFDLGTHIPSLSVQAGGRVAKLGRKYAYVDVSGALEYVKVAFDRIKNPDNAAPAQALAA
jgi:hypothetical protein